MEANNQGSSSLLSCQRGALFHMKPAKTSQNSTQGSPLLIPVLPLLLTSFHKPGRRKTWQTSNRSTELCLLVVLIGELMEEQLKWFCSKSEISMAWKEILEREII